MKKLLLPILFALVTALPLHADDRIRDIQTELKTQGFYYGEINGTYSTETTAALRRYQIRNGLEVTGTLTDETLKSLNPGSAPAPEPPSVPPAPVPPSRPTPPRATPPLEESDRNFLRREETRPSPAPPDIEPAPSRFDPSSSEFPALFAGTPYATAPREVQQATLRRAQSQLASRGLYRDLIDGEPGPATEGAILSYQRMSRLPGSGRLDLETLSALRLLPGRTNVPLKGFIAPRSPREPPVYRGIWVR